MRPGFITKEVSLRRGHNAVYQTHRVDGFAGPTPVAHHAILAAQTPLYLNTAPLHFGVTDRPGPSFHAGGEYYSIKREQEFQAMQMVPSVWKDEPTVDVSVFPAREGFVDVVQVVPDYERSGTAGTNVGWFTATAPEEGWLWFSLKDRRVQPTTVLWMENHGRHAAPWNGRNVSLGIEDACSYLSSGLAGSVPENPVSRRDIPTYHDLSADSPLTVPYIQGVCRIPGGFDRVADARIEGDGVTFVARSGAEVHAAVDVSFITGA